MDTLSEPPVGPDWLDCAGLESQKFFDAGFGGPLYRSSSTTSLNLLGLVPDLDETEFLLDSGKGKSGSLQDLSLLTSKDCFDELMTGIQDPPDEDCNVLQSAGQFQSATGCKLKRSNSIPKMNLIQGDADAWLLPPRTAENERLHSSRNNLLSGLLDIDESRIDIFERSRDIWESSLVSLEHLPLMTSHELAMIALSETDIVEGSVSYKGVVNMVEQSNEPDLLNCPGSYSTAEVSHLPNGVICISEDAPQMFEAMIATETLHEDLSGNHQSAGYIVLELSSSSAEQRILPPTSFGINPSEVTRFGAHLQADSDTFNVERPTCCSHEPDRTSPPDNSGAANLTIVHNDPSCAVPIKACVHPQPLPEVSMKQRPPSVCLSQFMKDFKKSSDQDEIACKDRGNELDTNIDCNIGQDTDTSCSIQQDKNRNAGHDVDTSCNIGEDADTNCRQDIGTSDCITQQTGTNGGIVDVEKRNAVDANSSGSPDGTEQHNDAFSTTADDYSPEKLSTMSAEELQKAAEQLRALAHALTTPKRKRKKPEPAKPVPTLKQRRYMHIVDQEYVKLGLDPSSAVKCSTLSLNAQGHHWSCQFSSCSRTFEAPSYALAHHLTHYGVKPFKCSFNGCTAAFNFNKHLKYHQATHANASRREKNVKCKLVSCDMKFISVRCMSAHFVTAHRSCPRCGKKLKRISRSVAIRNEARSEESAISQSESIVLFCNCVLPKEHRVRNGDLSVEESRPFTSLHDSTDPDDGGKNPGKMQRGLNCDEKDSTFSKQPWTCDVCGLKFPAKAKLTTHKKMHPKDHSATHFCDFEGCGKLFSSRHCLRRHQLSHTQDRKFICPLSNCCKGFTRPDHLQIHVRGFHLKQKPYSCQREGCNFAAMSMTALKRHGHSCKEGKVKGREAKRRLEREMKQERKRLLKEKQKEVAAGGKQDRKRRQRWKEKIDWSRRVMEEVNLPTEAFIHEIAHNVTIGDNLHLIPTPANAGTVLKTHSMPPAPGLDPHTDLLESVCLDGGDGILQHTPFCGNGSYEQSSLQESQAAVDRILEQAVVGTRIPDTSSLLPSEGGNADGQTTAVPEGAFNTFPQLKTLSGGVCFAGLKADELVENHNPVGSSYVCQNPARMTSFTANVNLEQLILNTSDGNLFYFVDDNISLLPEEEQFPDVEISNRSHHNIGIGSNLEFLTSTINFRDLE